MTKPTLIKAAYFYQSVNINNKEVFSVQSGKEILVSRKTGNYSLHWIDNALHVLYNDGQLDIVPVGNIKKMSVDIEETKKLWQKENDRLPEPPKAKARRSRTKIKQEPS